MSPSLIWIGRQCIGRMFWLRRNRLAVVSIAFLGPRFGTARPLPAGLLGDAIDIPRRALRINIPWLSRELYFARQVVATIENLVR